MDGTTKRKSSSCFQQDSCQNRTLQTAVHEKEEFQKGIEQQKHKVVSYGTDSYIWTTLNRDATHYVAESETSDTKLPALISHLHMKLLCHIGKHLNRGMYVCTHTKKGFIKTPCIIGICNHTLWENKPNYIHKEYNGLSVFVHQHDWKNNPIYLIEPPDAAEGISANALNFLDDLMEMQFQGPAPLPHKSSSKRSANDLNFPDDLMEVQFQGPASLPQKSSKKRKGKGFVDILRSTVKDKQDTF